MGTWEEFTLLDARAQVTRGLEVMREVVAEYGADYVYNGPCIYVEYANAAKGLAPQCLIGHVLARLGMPLDTMLSEAVSTTAGRLALPHHGPQLWTLRHCSCSTLRKRYRTVAVPTRTTHGAMP